MNSTKILSSLAVLFLIIVMIKGGIDCITYERLEPKEYIEPCPDGFVRWRGNCIAENVTVYTPDCPEGYAITNMDDAVNCTAGLWVNIKGDTFR